MGMEDVYTLLSAHRDSFISGQALSRKLGVSRAAIWKAVAGLRREGYTIEARTGLGYRLIAAPDTLTGREIRSYLPEGTCGDLRCFQEIDSTNSYLKREAVAGAADGVVAVADCQTAGRGRQDRRFLSSHGRGVYLSILLRPDLPPGDLLRATGMAAVAVCNAIARAAGVRPGIKWTNDLVLNGKKLCGILSEISVEGETGRTQSLVIGAGVNVSQTPEDFGPAVAAMATSLAQEGISVPRAKLAATMIEEFYRLSDALGGDLTEWIAQYRQDCVTLGKDVQLLWTANQERAVALDIDDQFGLVVRHTDGSVTTVRSGEVSVRGLYGYI